MDQFFLDTINVKVFNLSNNDFTDEAGAKLARALCQNRSLNVIDLRNNNLSEKTGILLMPATKMNTSLVKIRLEFNICRVKVI